MPSWSPTGCAAIGCAARPFPFNPAYRFMLATRSTSRIVAHERPDVIEVGSAYFAPWLIFRARRQYQAPAVWFYHANLPRLVAPRQDREPAPRRALASVVGWYTRRIAAAVDCTIVASDFARRDLERVGVTNVAYVPLGVDLDLFHPARHAADAIGPCAAGAAGGTGGTVRRAVRAREACGTARGGLGRGLPPYRGHARHGG